MYVYPYTYPYPYPYPCPYPLGGATAPARDRAREAESLSLPLPLAQSLERGRLNWDPWTVAGSKPRGCRNTLLPNPLEGSAPSLRVAASESASCRRLGVTQAACPRAARRTSLAYASLLPNPNPNPNPNFFD